MTADIRAAARKAAFDDHYSHKQVPDRYDADLLIAGFMDGAEWAHRVIPTREQIAIVLAKQKAPRWDTLRGVEHVVLIHAEYGAADAVLALMQELAEGRS